MIIYICMCVHINLWQMHMHISTCKKQKSSSGVISQKAHSLFRNSHSLAWDILCKLVGWPVSSCFLKLLLKIESNESRANIFKTENLCESCFFWSYFLLNGCFSVSSAASQSRLDLVLQAAGSSYISKEICIESVIQ